jgi:hypothetical protein
MNTEYPERQAQDERGKWHKLPSEGYGWFGADAWVRCPCGQGLFLAYDGDVKQCSCGRQYRFTAWVHGRRHAATGGTDH